MTFKKVWLFVLIATALTPTALAELETPETSMVRMAQGQVLMSETTPTGWLCTKDPKSTVGFSNAVNSVSDIANGLKKSKAIDANGHAGKRVVAGHEV